MRKLLARIFLVFALASGSSVHAKIKYYQYDGDIPFIEMMLNMMSVMGIIDKVPVEYMPGNNYGRYGFSQPYPHWPNTYKPHAYNSRPFPGGPYNRYSVLNGLWVARNGEMLGIKNQRFLWDDGNQRYLVGELELKNGVMIAHIKGVNRQLPYRYTIRNNELVTKDRNGVVKVFRRVNIGRNL